MKKHTALLITAVILDVLNLIGNVIGTILGSIMLFYMVEDYGGIEGYLRELSNLLKPDGEYWALYVILVGPILIASFLIPVYCMAAVIIDIIKFFIGIGILQSNVLEYDSVMRKNRMLFITSIITLNYLSAILYGIIKDKMQKEYALRMNLMQNYPMHNYQPQNYPTQWVG